MERFNCSLEQVTRQHSCIKTTMSSCCIAPLPCVSGTTFSVEYSGVPDGTSVYLPYGALPDVSQPYILRLQSPSLVTLTMFADIALASSAGEASVSVDLIPRRGDIQSQTLSQTIPVANAYQALSATLQATVPAGTYEVQGVVSGPGTITVDARFNVQVIRAV